MKKNYLLKIRRFLIALLADDFQAPHPHRRRPPYVLMCEQRSRCVRDLVQRLESIRKKTGLNQSDFYPYIGIPVWQISAMKAGKYMPHITMLYSLMNYAPAINLYWLLTGEGDPLLDDQALFELTNSLASAVQKYNPFPNHWVKVPSEAKCTE